MHETTPASLVETSKLNGVEPEGHLADVLTRLADHRPDSWLDELPPWSYVA